MKLLRIGSAATCDIILDSEYVSALHAEITLLDNGEVTIADKGSLNGTFIGNKQIAPNQEVTIRRGTPIRCADVELSWNRIPKNEVLTGYKAVYNIGSSQRNEIVVNSQLVSRFHASLRIKGHTAYLHDNGSKNGSFVNDKRVPSGIDVKITRSDNIVCGDEDITMLLKPYIPSRKSWFFGAGIAGLLVLCVLSFWGLWILFFGSQKPADFRNSVVYIRAGYHYTISLDDDPMGLNIQLRYPAGENGYFFEQATAFFIDKDGIMGTNRHVALPWEYRSKEEEENMHQLFEEYMAKELKVDIVHLDNFEDVKLAWRRLSSTRLGTLLLAGCKSVEELNARIARYRRAKIKIEGKMDYITVGFPGRHYTHNDEFQRCYVVAESGNIEKDVALLQLNDKKTPESVTTFLDINQIQTKDLVPMADRLYTIGYPNGIDWGLATTANSLEPNIREVKCSKLPGQYDFEVQESSIEGSSGSPIFNTNGQLVGILSKAFAGASTCAVKAKFLRELYEKNVNNNE